MPLRILFICTGNACRSQLAEALLRLMGGERFAVSSAGSHCAGFVHPVAEEVIRRRGGSVEGQYSKGWDEFASAEQDVIITLCAQVARLTPPAWPGRPITMNWPLTDPSFVSGSEAKRLAAGEEIARTLEQRFAKLIALPLETMSAEQLRDALEQIGAS